MRSYVRIVLPVLVACALGATMTATAVEQPAVTFEQELEQLNVGALSDDLIQSVQATLDALDPVIAEHHALYGLHRVDWDTKSIVVFLTDEPKTPEVRKSLETAASAVAGGAEVHFQTARVTMDELDQASRKLFASRKEWAQDPAAVYYTYPDVPNATIQVGIGDLAARGNRLAEGKTLSGATYKIEYFVEPGPGEPEAGSRLSDRGGWTGGNWLGTNSTTVPGVNNSHCGLGFTWRRWANGALVGGTAEHCINERDDATCAWEGTSYPTLWHDGRRLGTALLTDPASDSALLAPATGTSFNASAWVGPPSTTVERTVTGAREYDAQGDVVVLSGPRNGGVVTETLVYALRASSCFGAKTLVRDYVSEGGDSGSPWLTTYGNGTVRAHGQHHGNIPYGGQNRSAYTPVSVISARLQASIAVP